MSAASIWSSNIRPSLLSGVPPTFVDEDRKDVLLLALLFLAFVLRGEDGKDALFLALFFLAFALLASYFWGLAFQALASCFWGLVFQVLALYFSFQGTAFLASR